MKLIYRFAFDMLAEDRRRRLADRTAFSVEERLLNPTGVVQLQFDPDLITAEWILFAVRTGRTGEVPFVVRALVMIEDVIVVKLFIHSGTYACCVRRAA